MKGAKILDSFALLAFLQDEQGAQTIEGLLLDAQEGKAHLVISVVNLGEVWYSIARTTSSKIADEYAQQIQSMPVEVVDVDWSLARQAAIYKARGNVSYADCFVAALAKITGGEIVTGDREFEQLEDEVKIAWL